MPYLPPEPLTVGRRPQLFLDREFVEDCDQARRVVQQPQRDPPDGPVLCATLPWEGEEVYGSGSVLYDTEHKRFRMWYQTRYQEGAAEDAEHEVFRKRTSGYGAYRGGYAESSDGIHWDKPDLKLVELPDAPAVNCLFREGQVGLDGKPLVGPSGAGCFSVLEHPYPPDENHRFVLLTRTTLVGARDHHIAGAQFEIHFTEKQYDTLFASNEKTLENQTAMRNGMSINFSPDGLRWFRSAEEPIFPYWADALNTLVWDPDRELWSVYHRYYAGTCGDNKQWSPVTRFRRARRVARMESRDLMTWSTPQIVMPPDETDPHVSVYYGMPTFWYHGLYIGQVYVWDIATDRMEVHLAWSRDGIHFERHPLRRPWLIPGGPGAWDRGAASTIAAPVEVGDEMFVYYTGSPSGFHMRAGGDSAIGRAVLRKEGFVSIRGSVETGWVLTRPILCPGGPLMVNTDATGGGVQVEVLDPEWIPYRAQPLNGCSRENCLAIARRDGVRLPVQWKDRPDRLDDLKGKPIRLRFWLQNADLFSYVFPEG